jgi:hypothetical protein
MKTLSCSLFLILLFTGSCTSLPAPSRPLPPSANLMAPPHYEQRVLQHLPPRGAVLLLKPTDGTPTPK